MLDDAAPHTDSPWNQLQSFRTAGVPRAEWAARLVSAGLDPESARVLVNSVDGPTPAKLPEPSFAPGINPLSSAFPFTELGLAGPSLTVGLYWLAFGAAVLLMLAVFFLLVALDIARLPDELLRLLSWVMGTIAVAALGWGSWRALNAVRIRRG